MMRNDVKSLRTAIVRSLRKQGFRVERGVVSLPTEAPTKDHLRSLHYLALRQKIRVAEDGLRRHEDRLLSFIAEGSEVVPTAVAPRVVQVRSDSEEELLFRYATLHWSIPVSSGYGRRMRFLVFDDANDKLIGLFGLGDPVAALRPRDEWIGWDRKTREANLYHVMDAYVLGAVPPYSQLLCGKLVAMLALSKQVRDAFARKYRGTKSLISGRQRVPHLAMVTTTSALGRSSLYNRLRIDQTEYWRSIGFTAGSGEFQFSNGVYERLKTFAQKNGEPSWRHEKWGEGFRNRREIVRQCLAELGFPRTLGNHGIKREVFVAPLGKTSLEYLRGEAKTPGYHDWTVDDLAAKFRDRWLLPRAARDPSFEEFARAQYRIWPEQRTRRRA